MPKIGLLNFPTLVFGSTHSLTLFVKAYSNIVCSATVKEYKAYQEREARLVKKVTQDQVVKKAKEVQRVKKEM